jgi:hypothetical protein
MESSQLLLTIAITITTILVVLTGLQLMFVLKELRRALKESKHSIWRPDKHEEKETRHVKDHSKKMVSIHSVLDKIRILAPSHSSKNKKFFIKEE